MNIIVRSSLLITVMISGSGVCEGGVGGGLVDGYTLQERERGRERGRESRESRERDTERMSLRSLTGATGGSMEDRWL